jgi:nucleotide-binding universal stress UspA family protein
MQASEHTLGRLLCPVDFSEKSARALQLAEGLSQMVGATLDVLYVERPRPGSLPDRALATNSEARTVWEEATLRRITDFVERTTGPRHPYHAYVRMGLPSKEIVRFARQYRVDTIVMGASAHEGATSAPTHVTERVIDQCQETPVMCVHTKTRLPSFIKKHEKHIDRVEQAGAESFPASDPPSFTPEKIG